MSKAVGLRSTAIVVAIGLCSLAVWSAGRAGAGVDPNDLPVLMSRSDFEEAGIHLDVPSREDLMAVKVDEEAALQVAEANSGLGGNEIRSDGAAFVGIFSHDRFDEEPGITAFQDRLSWIVEYEGSCVPIYGGIRSGETVTEAGCLERTFYVVVDAITGEFLFAFI